MVVDLVDAADDAADPAYYNFGTDDTFTVEGTAVSFAQFMEVLAAANNPGIPSIRIDSDERDRAGSGKATMWLDPETGPTGHSTGICDTAYFCLVLDSGGS